MNLDEIKGIGPKTIEYLNKLNINSVDDLIHYYPYRYNIYHPTDLVDTNETLIVTATISSIPKVAFIRKNFNKLSFNAIVSDKLINVIIFNRSFIKQYLTLNKEITLIGKYDKLKNTFTCNDIKLYKINGTEIEPVYHLVNGIKRKSFSKIINDLINNTSIDELLPSYIIDKYNLLNEYDSLINIHNPIDINKFKQAKLKLIYEELFIFMFKINLMKYKNQITSSYLNRNIDYKEVENIINKIPFNLTNDQLKAVSDIYNDFISPKRMNRLVLGDVGSGKTIVSFISIILNYISGYQSAMLAPTEVLATQHFNNFKSLFSSLNIKVELLVGSLKKSEKDLIKKKLLNNEIDVLIGTHALLTDDVEFNNIGLVITDEQHRFGVNQRKNLQNKGEDVDVLYMSATPIPRTYALTIYGDMDISIIEEKPSGRKSIDTSLVKTSDESTIYSKIREAINNGNQVYVVCPLIEENEESNLNDINKIFNNIKTNVSSSIDILHGKMKPKEKELVMNKFKSGETKVLVSTTVIEVGVDVKNATLMVIYNAERFGLATLHQLRGRVGRNDLASSCLLVTDKDTERLRVLTESNDGFYIAEKDFELRGSGDLFGIRQSGDMSFKIANIRRDYKILMQCKKDAEEFILNNIENNFRNYSYYKNIVNNLIDND